MSIIKVSIDKIYGILEPVDLELIKERVEVSNRMLSDGSGDGNDFLGWVDLPEQITPAQLDAVNDCAKSLASLAEVIVVIGIGGSYLGAKAVLEAMHCPEADWFMAHCLPCYTQNLDELTRQDG